MAAVREAMAALREVGDAAEVRAILQQRRDLLAGRSIALLRAGSDLADLIAGTPIPGGSQAS